MPLDGNQRALAQYQVTPHLDKLTGDVDAAGNPLNGEKLKLLQGLQAIYKADTAYLTGNAVVNPGTLSAAGLATAGNAAAQTVSAPGTLTGGTGTIS